MHTKIHNTRIRTDFSIQVLYKNKHKHKHKTFNCKRIHIIYVLCKLKANLLRFGHRITAVVGESRYVALVGGIDDFVGVQRHEVVVLILVVRHGASLELVVIQHLAHVLDYELTPEKPAIR